MPWPARPPRGTQCVAGGVGRFFTLHGEKAHRCPDLAVETVKAIKDDEPLYVCLYHAGGVVSTGQGYRNPKRKQKRWVGLETGS